MLRGIEQSSEEENGGRGTGDGAQRVTAVKKRHKSGREGLVCSGTFLLPSEKKPKRRNLGRYQNGLPLLVQ